MRFVYVFLLLVMLDFFSAPLTAEAHVKWFTELRPEKMPFNRILSPLFMLIALFTAEMLAVLTQILPAINSWKLMHKVEHKLDKLHQYSMYILKYGMAAALLIQALSGTLFVPEFQGETRLELILLWISIALLLIPHHWSSKAAAFVILYLFVYVTMRAGWFHMLDYGFYPAIILALLFDKTRLKQWGFPLLYLGTGLSLCWVAVEKWVFPGMAIDIIQQHNVPTFGFASETFVVLAAFIEFIVGYLLVVGILNRLLSLVLTGIFISTTMLFGLTELIGHFMIHIILIIFLIEGASFYKPPIQMHKTRLNQMVFVSLNFIFVLATFLLIYYRFA